MNIASRPADCPRLSLKQGGNDGRWWNRTLAAPLEDHWTSEVMEDLSHRYSSPRQFSPESHVFSVDSAFLLQESASTNSLTSSFALAAVHHGINL